MLKLRRNKKETPEPEKKPVAASPQGISASGNALHKILAMALLAILVPVTLGFSYLALVREQALQNQQVERVSASFALQQATNMDRLFSQLRDRVQSAAKSPLALSAIATRSREDIALVEQAMLDYFPEVIGLRIIPVGDMGTADFSDNNQGLRNHIEVDLVRRSSQDEETQPESYRFEDRWLTSIAARVTHPRISDRKAVIIATIDNSQLSKQLESLEKEAGRFTLQQNYATAGGALRQDTIAQSGPDGNNRFRRYSDIPNTTWQVGFAPSAALLSALTIPSYPLWVMLLITVLASIIALGLVLRMLPKELNANVESIISAADRKTQLALSIPALVPLAKQLRRATLRALRQSSAPATAAVVTTKNTDPVSDRGIPLPQVETLDSDSSHFSNPMFQSTALLDEEDGEILDLDLAEDREPERVRPPTIEGMPEHIFRAYDIRGDAKTELTDELVTDIGKAIGSIAGEMDQQTLLVACDGRSSSPRIKTAIIRALMETGRDVIDIGLVPTPLLYFATHHMEYASGVMITGSHNPADYNGLKIVLNQQTIAAGGIEDIRDRVVTKNFSSGNGRMIREDIIPPYIDAVLQDIAIAVPLKIVIDAGNGATGEIAPGLFEELGCEIIPLHCEIDGSFPNHPPDTSNEENLAALTKKVKETNADFGVAFDGDGDRLAVVTSSGRIVRSDVLLMLYAQDVVSRNPGADVVFDVKCSRNLTELITRHGGRPVLWKTGHAFMKEKMLETGALLGGEFSGHIFFGERWYGFDDGMYAAGRLAEILSTHGDSLDDCIDRFPTTINTPEILIPVDDNYKFDLIDNIISNADFSSGKVNTMDGIRVDFTHGWGLIRASNTGPALTARFEADTKENLNQIQDEFRAQIALIDPDIELTF